MAAACPPETKPPFSSLPSPLRFKYKRRAVVEFNIQTDPEAARLVFESGVRLTMVPLEVCVAQRGTPKPLWLAESGC